MQNFWNVYVIILGGLLAFASIRKQPAAITTLIVCLLFALFADNNLDAMKDVTAQRFATLQLIKEARPANLASGNLKSVIEPTLIPASSESVRRTHIISDVLAIAALIAMGLRRRRLFPTGGVVETI